MHNLINGINLMRLDILKIATPVAIFMIVVGSLVVMSGKKKEIGWTIIGCAIGGYIVAILAPDIINWVNKYIGSGKKF